MICDHVNAVAASNDWPLIASKDVKLMESLVKLLGPLTDMLLAWERDGLTISSVYNGLGKLLKFYTVRAFKKRFNLVFRNCRTRMVSSCMLSCF
jgi:hypothetical protein